MLRFRSLRVPVLAVAGVCLLGATRSPVNRGAAVLHARLIKSEPAANDTLRTSPAAVRLWFSEAVELPVTAVKLANTTGTAVPLAPLTRGDSAHAPVVAMIAKPLAAGNYVVTWRTTAVDGHPVKGSFAFRKSFTSWMPWSEVRPQPGIPTKTGVTNAPRSYGKRSPLSPSRNSSGSNARRAFRLT